MTKSIQVLLLYQMFSPQQPATMYHFQKKFFKDKLCIQRVNLYFQKIFFRYH